MCEFRVPFGCRAFCHCPLRVYIANNYEINLVIIEKDSSEQVNFSGSVLVVEDIPVHQLLIKKLLEKMGLQVRIAADGNEAIQKALSKSFDMIFMDIKMPCMNGYEATKALRKQGVTTPIIAVSAYAMKGDEKKCIEAGCDAYIPKPIDRRELLKIIGKYLPS